MYKVSKEIKWDQAHRLINYEGKCAELHGHTYTAIITFGCNSLDEKGFVLDFGLISEIMKGWIDKFWDHGTILHRDDPFLPSVMLYNKKVYTLPCNPTAENMAKTLFDICRTAMPQGKNYHIISVEVKETPTSSAVYNE